jgi:prepilin-type N-terminal cleavage/methylation domain-containing protein
MVAYFQIPEDTTMKLNKMAFTLIELLVVVLIIGILAAIALPQYQTAVLKSKVSSSFPLLRSLYDAQERYNLVTGSYATSLDQLDISISGNCTATACQMGNDYLWLPTTGSIVIYFNATSVDGTKFAVVIVYDFLKYNETISGSEVVNKNGQLLCADRNNEKFKKVCQSFSPRGSFDNESGKIWLIN